jgi:nitrogen fixation protein NifB
MGQPSPTAEQLQELQDECAGDMSMMRHCRQCRADAVGLLGEDRGAEFTMDKIDVMDIDYEAAMVKRKEFRDSALEMLEAKRALHAHAPAPADAGAFGGVLANARPVLMAVAAKNGLVGEHFGHAREFLVYEASPSGVRFIGHRKVDLYCGGMDTCGEGDFEPESILDKTIATLSGCEAVLCSKVGYEPWGKLEAAGIAPNGEHAMEPIEEAVMAVYREMAAAGKLAEPALVKKVA